MCKFGQKKKLPAIPTADVSTVSDPKDSLVMESFFDACASIGNFSSTSSHRSQDGSQFSASAKMRNSNLEGGTTSSLSHSQSVPHLPLSRKTNAAGNEEQRRVLSNSSLGISGLKRGRHDTDVRFEIPIDTSWAHYAGTLSREYSNQLLLFEEPGTFFVRRKSASILVLSFVSRCVMKLSHDTSV
jgi:hypothetical protein